MACPVRCRSLTRRAALVGSALVCVFGTVAIAHPDDPKLLDRNGNYEGHGWTKGRGWLGEPGTFGDHEVTRRRGPDGLLGPGFVSSNIDLLAWLTPSDLGSPTGEGSDCWGYVSGSGREYALITLTNATCFVEVTDPFNPVVIHTDSTVPNSAWHDIKTFGTYAYAVSEGGQGIRVYDLSDIDNGNVTRLSDVTAPGTPTSTHNIAIDTTSGFIYRCGGQSGMGLRMYDINANPAAPVYVGIWTDRYVHDAQIVTYTSGPYAGKQIAFCCAGFGNGGTDTALSIVDVTNKAAPVVLSTTPYSSRAYCHQGWLSDDRQYFYINDELDEQTFGGFTTMRIMDVSDLNAPVELTSFNNGQTTIDHNLYTHNGYIYAANYQSGLRVHDISNPTGPVEVGFFDTYPEGNSANFNGAWSNYPFLPSGTIIVSDIERGLFLFQFNAAQLAISLPSGEKEMVDPLGDTLDVQIDEVNGGQFDSARIYVDTGSGFVSSPLADLGGGFFTASFPSIPCGDPVSYYIEAESLGGQTTVLPVGAPTMTYQAVSGLGEVNTYLDDTEVDLGWMVGAAGDTATTGVWELADPVGTGAQPEDDATPDPGALCWITEAAAGPSIGSFDIDNGATTLISPTMDATSGTGIAFIGYSRWYSNNAGASPNEDSMTIDISNDDGANWVPLEVVTENLNVWSAKQFRIDDFLAPTNQMRLRFVASDLINGSIVEAGVDDVRIDFLQCPTGGQPGDVTGDGCVDLGDLNLVLFNFGSAVPAGTGGDADGNGFVDLTDLNLVLFNFGNGC